MQYSPQGINTVSLELNNAHTGWEPLICAINSKHNIQLGTNNEHSIMCSFYLVKKILAILELFESDKNLLKNKSLPKGGLV